MNNSKTVLINSENRTSGTSSDFTYLLPSDGEYTHVAVLGANIPVSYYLVQKPYNTFTLIEGNTQIYIDLEEGNYNVNSFKSVVKELLNSKSVNGYVYDMEFSNDYERAQTAKYTFLVSGNPPNVLPSIMFPDQGELHSQFGFEHGSTNTFNNQGKLVSTSVVNFIPESVLTIQSTLCEDSNLITIFNDNAMPYSNISFQCQTDLYKRKLRGRAKDSVYRFTVVNKNGQNINLNGQPILLNLLLFNDNERYKEDIQNYIKYRINK
jgi:hypothetical protein